ncbi:DUF192 domain-containing protein [Entomobacter blattae]|uniref:Putative ACR protein n=1 Tax=Entomobacter blattae TaxID=2762277 RepID=A0A7H1NQA4_9PROT|nr:DUF192 domain-containing protein [Entomobacter blattae]QNT77964.1 putative ACR protein [Entomobacter blattae]
MFRKRDILYHSTIIMLVGFLGAEGTGVNFLALTQSAYAQPAQTKEGAAEEGHAVQAESSPQKELTKEKLVITDHANHQHEFLVELALTPEEQQKGEMFRTSVPENGGMLFVWPLPQRSQMWMKNTLVPLDMVFISPEGEILSIVENTVPHSLAQIDSYGLVKATLELKGGTATRLGLQRGDKISSPSLKEAHLPSSASLPKAVSNRLNKNQ